MKRFKLWESDFTFTICLGNGTFQINADSTAVEDKIDILGISLFLNEWMLAIALIWERAGILAIHPSKFNCLKHFSRNAPHPDESQRRQLSREIGLAPNRVKFWFQNKRNQTKVRNDRADNNALRSENVRMRPEYQAFSAVMKNVICPTCDACPPVGEEARKLNVQKLRMGNSLLKEMHERLSNEITSMTGSSSSQCRESGHSFLKFEE